MRLAAFALAIACGLGSPSVVLAPTARALPPLPRLAIRQPEPSGTPAPQKTDQTIGDYLAGRATWYCGHGSRCTRGYHGGMIAAAGARLRAALGDWRGQSVRVCAASCVTVELVDCLCSGDGLIDLSADSFGLLAPLSRGVLAVTVMEVPTE